MIIINGIFEFIELGLDQCSVIVVGSIRIVLLYCALVMSECIFKLTKLVVALTAEVPVLSYGFGLSIR